MTFDIFHFQDKQFYEGARGPNTDHKWSKVTPLKPSKICQPIVPWFSREQVFPNVLPTRVGSNKTIQNGSHKLTIFLGVLRYPTIRGRLQIGLLHHFFKAFFWGAHFVGVQTPQTTDFSPLTPRGPATCSERFPVVPPFWLATTVGMA